MDDQSSPVFSDPKVAAVFAAYPDEIRHALLALRDTILDVAREDGAGRIEETLKWGQPSYLTAEGKRGTTIRIDRDAKHGGDIALYVNCQTTLVGEWRERFPDMVFGGTRSLHFRIGEDLDERVRICISMALNYHMAKR
jgi:hypothetical protein